VKTIKVSDELLKATLNSDEDKVAELIDHVHSDNTSPMKYNDENSLICVISLAYYLARKDYIIHCEIESGEEFEDVVFIPRKKSNKPAMNVELKKRSHL
jgi:hypothetical protein rflaF_20304